jgi:hypothetical protein
MIIKNYFVNRIKIFNTLNHLKRSFFAAEVKKPAVPQGKGGANIERPRNPYEIPKFKPFEEMDPNEIKQKITDWKSEMHYYYSNPAGPAKLKAMNKTEFLAKKMRHMYLISGDFCTNKHILPVKRVRTNEDSIFGLLKQDEIACILEGREEFPDFHFVLDRKFVRSFNSKPHWKVKPFYLQHGNQETRCTVIEKARLPTYETPYKMRFQRYIVGRPNLLTLEIKFVGRELNPYLRDMDIEFAQYFNKFDIWTVNDEYPPLLEIDVRRVFPWQPYKIIDLKMDLPEGMWLHRKYDNLMYQAICSMGENYNYFLSSNIIPFDESYKTTDELEAEMMFDSDEEEELKKKEEAKKVVKKKTPHTMPVVTASAKKLMQIKGEGATRKALKDNLKKIQMGLGPKKEKKGKKPEKAEGEEPAK